MAHLLAMNVPVKRDPSWSDGAKMTRAKIKSAGHNIVIDPGEVEIPEGSLHIKETATVGMEMLYQSLVKLSERT
jgi:hypothetical protein